MAAFNQSRQTIIEIVFAATFFIVVAQLVNLQIVSRNYGQEAFSNAIYKKVIYPSRGVVFDRKKRTILNNSLMYDLMVVPSAVKNIDTVKFCKVLQIDTIEFKKRIKIAREKNTAYRPSIFQPLLNPEMFARLNENIYLFNGFDLVERPVRVYPFNAAGNILGYLGEVDTNILKKPKYVGYQMGDYIGIAGLEKSYEKVLMGQRGIEYKLRDKLNRITGSYMDGKIDTASVPGSNLYTSIDIELQELGEKLMSNKIGSVVAINPKTGGILSMVSAPNFNPQLLTGNERGKNFGKLLKDPRKPLQNRAVYGKYSPGSTFKTLIGLIGLQEQVIEPSSGYPCSGRYRACGGKGVGCHGAGHAPNLKLATAVSCNSYFCNTFRKIIDQPKFANIDSGLRKWDAYMSAFGLGHKLGVDVPTENKGNIPTPEYYDKIFKNSWNSCTIVSVGIGQGEVDATILQMANAIAMIANKGWYYTPHVVDSIDGGDAYNVLDSFKTKRQAISIPDSMFEAIHDGMEAVVQSGYGTAKRVAIPDIIMCGKTGTVENYIRGVKQKNHSFFAAFAPRDNPKIALACIVENGGYGAAVAAPIVSLMIEKYLNDTISKKRKLMEEATTKINLIPPRIYAELRIQDSAEHAKDTAYLIEKGFIKIVEDSTDVEEEKENNLKMKAIAKEEGIALPVEISASTKKVPEKKENKKVFEKTEALLPEEEKSKPTLDTAGNHD